MRLTADAVLCKMNQVSEWDRRPLRKGQLHYAAMDAYALLLMYDALLKSPSAEEEVMA